MKIFKDVWRWCWTPALYASVVLLVLVTLVMYGPKVTIGTMDLIIKTLSDLIAAEKEETK